MKRWGGVFYHPEFVDTASKFLNLDGSSCYLNIDGRRICALNLLFRKRKIMRAATIPLFFQYFGPLFMSYERERDYLLHMDDHLSERCDFAYLSFTPQFHSAEVLPSGWRVFRNVTLAFEADDLRIWGENFRDDVKNKIRKARRESIRIEKTDLLPEELWTLSYTRKGIKPPLKPITLKRWCEALIENSLLSIYVAKKDDIPIAFRAQLVFGDFAYDWIAGSDPQYHATGANQLLMAEIGRCLMKLKIKTWDLVNGRIKGIADFKKSFGAREFYYYQALKAFSAKGKLFGVLRKLKNG